MLYFSSEYATIAWNTEISAVELVWLQNPSSEALRTALSAGLELLRMKRGQFWLTDLTHFKLIEIDDQEWGLNVWTPQAIAIGLKKLATVQPGTALSRINSKEYFKKSTYESAAFPSIDEARQWLKMTNQHIATPSAEITPRTTRTVPNPAPHQVFAPLPTKSLPTKSFSSSSPSASVIQYFVLEPHLKVWWDEEKRTVHADFTGFAKGEKLRNGLDHVLNLIRTKNARLYLPNLREFAPTDKADQEWFYADWMPRAVKAGLKRMAVVMPEKVVAQMSVRNVMENVQGVETMTFSNERQASDWLTFRALQVAYA